MIYGELIVGLPGSGKTTYLKYKKNYLAGRNVYTVNLDPGRWEKERHVNNKDTYNNNVMDKTTNLEREKQSDGNNVMDKTANLEREKKSDGKNSDKTANPKPDHPKTANSKENAEPSVNNFTFDYDITNKYDTRKYMKQREIGPNLAVKKIMEEYVANYEEIRNIFCNEECYYLIDTPGQIESILNFDRLLLRLQRDGIRLVTVFLSDINSMTSIESLSYTYFMTMQTMVTLNHSQINVFTKLDLLDKIRLIDKLSNLIELALNVEEYPVLFKVLYRFIERESLIEYQVMEYREDVLCYLQFCIDQASGFINEIEDENTLAEYLSGIKEKEEIIRSYEEKEGAI
ncbi:putative Uncharacterized protein family, ATP binding protein [Trachipleistophora hominis]|uniref:GPN-loop GTPase 3 n=1 Tax=Trachipleistophora hominis TaxID=72359 RepID=L7JRT5_TRAHO|nr:putative Uncharacterized protein family, ATP binding protein [Trachipleistophora hominis]